MPEAVHMPRRGCRPRARVLLFVVIATAIALLVLAVYTMVDRPTTNKLTPAGANYNPGQTQDPSLPK